MKIFLVALLFFIGTNSFAQNCLDNKAKNQLSSIQSLNGDYETNWKKTVTLTSGKSVSNEIKVEGDEQYIIVLVCNSSAKGCGLELQDQSGTQLNYVINYSGAENYYATIEFDVELNSTYHVVCNSTSSCCAQLILLSKVNEDEDEKTKRKY